jgi:hypothetical protein
LISRDLILLSTAGWDRVTHSSKVVGDSLFQSKTHTYYVFCGGMQKERILFYQNEAEKLLKTKDGCGKNRQNEPETNLKRS